MLRLTKFENVKFIVAIFDRLREIFSRYFMKGLIYINYNIIINNTGLSNVSASFYRFIYIAAIRKLLISILKW